MNIRFERASTSHEAAVANWLTEPHMKEFWDNSPEHFEDIKIFMNGRTVPSPYFGGMNSYWIGLIDDDPYSLIMTHEESDATDPPEYFKPYLSKTGKTIGLDFAIGNPQYFGQGLASPTLIAFMDYFAREIEPNVETYLIDPFINNPRAIHVYQKAGFEIMCEFTQDGGYFDQTRGLLMVKRV